MSRSPWDSQSSSNSREKGNKGRKGRLSEGVRVPKDRQWCYSPMLVSPGPRQCGNRLSSLSWSREREIHPQRERHKWIEMTEEKGKREKVEQRGVRNTRRGRENEAQTEGLQG